MAGDYNVKGRNYLIDNLTLSQVDEEVLRALERPCNCGDLKLTFDSSKTNPEESLI